MKNIIPPNENEALARVQDMLKAKPNALSKEVFLRGWFSVAFLFPGLHPDDCPEEAGEMKLNPDLPADLKTYDSESGWPVVLIPYCLEAFCRAAKGELKDNELYPVAALKARVL